jgi:hypothetical protein
MGAWNISTWILIVFDAMGVWLLVRPSDLMNLWTARRAPASEVDRFIARLVGVILLSTQVTTWASRAKNTNAEPIMHWLSIFLGVCAVVFLGYHFVRLLASKPDRRAQVAVAERRFLLPESDEETRPGTEPHGKSIGCSASRFRSLFLVGSRLVSCSARCSVYFIGIGTSQS